MPNTLKKLVLFASFFLLCLNVQAQEQNSVSVTAEGVAVVYDANVVKARDQAVNDALRKAVEQAVGKMISAETVVENYEVLSDNIYAKTQGYIQNYTIINERQEDTLYYVTVQAKVAEGELKNDVSALGLLMARKNMPRIMIMVAEQNVGMEHYYYWWNVVTAQADLTVTENTLMNVLSEKGFNVIDHSVKAKNVKLSNAYKIDTLNNDAIKSIGNMYDAEVVIYGKSIAKLAGSVMGTSMLSSQADVALRAVNTDNGQVIASATNHAAAVHPNDVTAGTEALKKATEGIAEDLVDQIVRKWNQDVGGNAMVEIIISGVNSYNNLVTFKKALQKNVRGVTAVHQRGFDAGIATLDVELSGSAQDVADELAMINYTGFSINITGITQNSIRITMAPK